MAGPGAAAAGLIHSKLIGCHESEAGFAAEFAGDLFFADSDDDSFVADSAYSAFVVAAEKH